MALVVKNPSANAGDIREAGSVHGSGRSPREGIGNPLQYSCLESPLDRGTWQAAVHGIAKSQTWLSRHVHTHTQFLTGVNKHSFWTLPPLWIVTTIKIQVLRAWDEPGTTTNFPRHVQSSNSPMREMLRLLPPDCRQQTWTSEWPEPPVAPWGTWSLDHDTYSADIFLSDKSIRIKQWILKVTQSRKSLTWYMP